MDSHTLLDAGGQVVSLFELAPAPVPASNGNAMFPHSPASDTRLPTSLILVLSHSQPKQFPICLQILILAPPSRPRSSVVLNTVKLRAYRDSSRAALWIGYRPNTGPCLHNTRPAIVLAMPSLGSLNLRVPSKASTHTAPNPDSRARLSASFVGS